MSSSSSAARTYDVFPSFHGKDVRRSFLAYLRTEFKDKGIDAFSDNDMERGTTITPELIKAIEGSRIAVVVFSKNYASSTWCLDELVQITRCKEAFRQTVMTVFYEVDPSHVRKQEGDFGKVFKKTCVEKTKKRVEGWRQALEKVGKICGDVFKKTNDDDEKQKRIQGWKKALKEVGEIVGEHTDSWVNDDPGLIKKVVTDVSNKLFNSTQSRDFGDLVGMDAHMKKMKPLLRLDLEEVRMIGIWGPPGIGKTTIARYIFKHHSKGFQLSTIMEDTRARSRDHYLDLHGKKLKLQRDFLAQIINQDDLKITHLECVPDRLKNKKVLVVLDDVDWLEQIEATAKTIEWFGPGSRIIIISEDLDVLERHDDIKYIYKVPPPNDKEALEIFCKNAFHQKIPKDGFKELARAATQLSLGLPFGLKILGSHFKIKTKQEWEGELLRLRTSLHGDINSIFKFSYEALWDKDKELFLRISHFFKGEKIERLQAFLGDSLKTGIEVLVKKSLISKDLGYIKMHNLLVQFGREIVRYDPIQKSICGQFLDDAKEIVQVLTDETGSRSLIGIDLKLSQIKRKTEISESAFKRIWNLQFLRVYYQHRDNSSDMFLLQQNLDYLSRELRLLHWEHFEMKIWPSNFNTEFLVELNMPHNKLEKLWENIEHLENLRWVDLKFSKNLKELPDLSTATKLQRLDLRSCSSLEELPDSIGKAINLEELNMSGCSNLKKLPSSIKVATNLQRLFLSRCSGLEELPSSIWNATNLVYLDLSYCSNLVELPAPIKKSTRLVHLNLRHCSKLKKFPMIGNLVNLQKLYLGGCSSLLKLSPSLGNATNIIELDLNGCSSLEELPSSIRKFHKLPKLNLQGCSNLKTLPSNIKMESLNELDLTDCSLLTNFPEVSTNVKVLKLSGTAIDEVPSSIMSWSRLSELHMSYFENLKKFQHALHIITVLHLSDTETHEIGTWIKNLPRLRQLVLKGCRNLTSLPQLPKSLCNLDAENCESLERLDWSFDHQKSDLLLNFANCINLNENARDLIIQTSTRRYAVLPGGEVPLYFTDRVISDSVTVKLSQRPLPTSLRFKVCICLVKGVDNAGDRKKMRVSSYMDKPNDLIVKNRPSSQFLSLLLTEHMYIFEIEAEVKASKLKFAFKVDSDKWKIGKCGVKILEVLSGHEHGESSRGGNETKLAESVDSATEPKLELKSNREARGDNSPDIMMQRSI